MRFIVSIIVILSLAGCMESFEHQNRIEGIGHALLEGREAVDLRFPPEFFPTELGEFVARYKTIEVVARPGDTSYLDNPENYPPNSNPATHLLVFRSTSKEKRIELVLELTYDKDIDLFIPHNGSSIMTSDLVGLKTKK